MSRAGQLLELVLLVNHVATGEFAAQQLKELESKSKALARQVEIFYKTGGQIESYCNLIKHDGAIGVDLISKLCHARWLQAVSRGFGFS